MEWNTGMGYIKLGLMIHSWISGTDYQEAYHAMGYLYRRPYYKFDKPIKVARKRDPGFFFVQVIVPLSSPDYQQ